MHQIYTVKYYLKSEDVTNAWNPDRDLFTRQHNIIRDLAIRFITSAPVLMRTTMRGSWPKNGQLALSLAALFLISDIWIGEYDMYGNYFRQCFLWLHHYIKQKHCRCTVYHLCTFFCVLAWPYFESCQDLQFHFYKLQQSLSVQHEFVLTGGVYIKVRVK